MPPPMVITCVVLLLLIVFLLAVNLAVFMLLLTILNMFHVPCSMFKIASFLTILRQMHTMKSEHLAARCSCTRQFTQASILSLKRLSNLPLNTVKPNFFCYSFGTAASSIDKICSSVAEAKRIAILFFSRASQSDCAESIIHSCGIC